MSARWRKFWRPYHRLKQANERELNGLITVGRIWSRVDRR